MAEEERLVERRHNYDSLAGLVEEALGSLRARDEDVVLNAERLKTVVRTTTEIKEQLVIMNGRVRENREDVIAIKATPSLTREYYDTQREKVIGRIRVLEGKAPAFIQSAIIGLSMGGVLAGLNYLLSRSP